MEASRSDTLFTEQHSQFAESIIGGEGGLSFRPEIRCKRWGEEGSFTFRLPSLATVSPTIDREKGIIQWLDDASKTGLRCYALDDGRFESGGLEIEIILLARPTKPELRMAFESSGLDLFWQPELSLAE